MPSEKERRIRSRNDFLVALPREEVVPRLTGTFFTPLEFVSFMRSETIEEGWYGSILRSPEQGRFLYEATVLNENLKHP
jgi:hypothetical protein